MNDLAIGCALRPDDEIARHRAAISSLDERLLALLSERLEHALAIGEAKRALGERVRQPAREAQILTELGARSTGPLAPSHVQAIWSEIFRASRALQEGACVAFLGPLGTYTEDAMHAQFGKCVHGLSCESVDAVFQAIERGDACYGVVPIENSTEGTIPRTLDLVFEKSMQIFAEVVLPIAHSIMAADGALERIARVAAHPQALAQCRAWLDAHLPHVERNACASNADAAQLAATTLGTAAIGSRRAAEYYGLTVLSSGIQDERSNSTRFAVFGRETAAPREGERTLIAVELENGVGALLRCLAPLAARGVAVTRIDSRPLRSEPWAYRFFIEVGCSRHHPDLLDALFAMRTVVTSIRVLGAYAVTARQDEACEDEPIDLAASVRAARGPGACRQGN